MTATNPKVLDFFERRRIEPELAVRIGICSVTRQSTGDVIPDPKGEVIEFPFFRDGKKVGAKYRAAGKRFWQKPNCIKCFMNSDVLSDPALGRGDVSLVITEGELDLLTALQCGFPHTVSVPDGAPPESFVSDPLPDPDMDNKFSYVALDWDRLKVIKRIIIAVDNDGPGKRLAEELVRRLGRVRCQRVEYPEGCKDLNDVLMNRGSEEVIRVLSTAKNYPIDGLYEFDELPPEPAIEYRSTGWARMDDLLRVFLPGILVVTGFAGAGKTTWVNQLVAQLALKQGWSIAIASFEMRLDPYVTDALRTVRLKKSKAEWSPEDWELTNKWIKDNFIFISTTQSDAHHDIGWLIERAEDAVGRKGVKVLLIDPWNEIEHTRARNENLTEYTGRALQALKRFGANHDCFVIVVTHPTKVGATKKSDDLNLYDCSDSAHFANKADLGVVIKQGGDGSNLSEIIVCKVRYIPDMGKPGKVILSYDPALRLFAE